MGPTISPRNVPEEKIQKRQLILLDTQLYLLLKTKANLVLLDSLEHFEWFLEKSSTFNEGDFSDMPLFLAPTKYTVDAWSTSAWSVPEVGERVGTSPGKSNGCIWEDWVWCWNLLARKLLIFGRIDFIGCFNFRPFLSTIVQQLMIAVKAWILHKERPNTLKWY